MSTHMATMKKSCIFLAVFLLFTTLGAAAKEEEEDPLLLVQFLFRHGDRTPVVLYKTDQYKEENFTEGLGQLTAVGKARIHRYGDILRQRYSKYIDSTLPRNVRAQSSPSRRCLESSQLLLSGLFPPSAPQMWSNDSELSHLWQPIAVETTEKPRAWLLNSEATCPNAVRIENVIVELPEVKKFLDDHKEWIKELEKYSGEDYSSWYDVGYLWDTLFTEKEYFGAHFSPPKWLSLVGNDTWDRLYRFNEMEIGVFSLAPEYQRLRGGPFLRQITSNMNNTANKGEITVQTRQVFTYGSHDTMISYILQALGFFKQSPTYGSGLIIELRRDSTTHQPHVHLFYSNVTNNFDIYPLALNESKTFSKKCPLAHCALVDFTASLETFFPVDHNKECNPRT